MLMFSHANNAFQAMHFWDHLGLHDAFTHAIETPYHVNLPKLNFDILSDDEYACLSVLWNFKYLCAASCHSCLVEEIMELIRFIAQYLPHKQWWTLLSITLWNWWERMPDHLEKVAWDRLSVCHGLIPLLRCFGMSSNNYGILKPVGLQQGHSSHPYNVSIILCSGFWLQVSK